MLWRISEAQSTIGGGVYVEVGCVVEVDVVRGPFTLQ